MTHLSSFFNIIRRFTTQSISDYEIQINTITKGLYDVIDDAVDLRLQIADIVSDRYFSFSYSLE